MARSREDSGFQVARSGASADRFGVSGSTILRAASRVVLAVMVVLLGWRLCQFLHIGFEALGWPYELDYAEGIVWQQARLMLTLAAYAPIDRFPAIVFHYTPLYHLVCRALAGVTGADLLFTGRAVSIGSTLLLAPMVGLVIVRAAPVDSAPRERLAMAVVGGLCVFSLYPVLACGDLMRVDMLAVLLAVIGFWLGLKALERPVLIHLAAIFFVAALYTKQTMVAAPGALFGVLLWQRPALAFRGLVTATILGLAAFSAITWATDGGFPRHIFVYNINRVSLRELIHIVDILRAQALFVVVAIVMAVARWRSIRERLADRSPDTPPLAIADMGWMAVVCYFATTSVMLVTVMKSGAFLNYFIEWLLVVVMLVGCGLADAARVATGRSRPAVSFKFVLGAVILPCAIAVQAAVIDVPDPSATNTVRHRQDVDALSARMRAAPQPIISDEMVLLLRSGKDVLFEPMIFTELASMGTWDERPFVARIRARQFAMIVTDQPHDVNRYTPAMWQAIDSAYPVIERQAGYTLHLPARAVRRP